MRKGRFATEQIIGFIKQSEGGMVVAELERQLRFSPASLYLWRAKYGDMEVTDAKRLKTLEAENNRLKKLWPKLTWILKPYPNTWWRLPMCGTGSATGTGMTCCVQSSLT